MAAMGLWERVLDALIVCTESFCDTIRIDTSQYQHLMCMTLPDNIYLGKMEEFYFCLHERLADLETLDVQCNLIAVFKFKDGFFLSCNIHKISDNVSYDTFKQRVHKERKPPVLENIDINGDNTHLQLQVTVLFPSTGMHYQLQMTTEG